MARGLRIGYARAVRIAGDPGSYAFAGQAAALNRGRTLDASQGIYTQTGQTATLTYSGTATGAIDRLAINTEQATPEHIGLYLPATAVVAGGSVTVRYKPTSSSTYSTAHPLLRISTTGNESGGPTTIVDAYAGTIFDLSQNTTYDVELTHIEAGQPTKITTIQRTTRALPAVAGAANKTIAAGTSAAAIQTAFNGLVAGDVIQFAAGTYTVASLTLTNSGTAGSPIYIRGASRTGVILSDTTNEVLTISASHVIFENMTVRGSLVDGGITPDSIGILINGARTNVTIRYMDVTGVDQAVANGGSELTGALIYGCVLTGNNPWSEASNANVTWNDTGIEIPGFGNCAFQNTLNGFGDSFAVTRFLGDGLRSEGIYFYRNRVNNNGDDLIEFDYGTRNIACYDNLVTNTGTAMSASYEFGGPSYYFRNVVVNTIRGPYKINGNGTGVTGFMIYNNTIVRTDGTTGGWGMIQTGTDGAWKNYSFRNNLLVYRGSASGGLAALEQPGNNPCDFDYNAWFPDNDVWWTNSGGTWANMSAAKAGLLANTITPLFGSSQRMQHDALTVTNPFVNAITLGATHATEYTATPDATLSASGPKNIGVSIPGITDGFSGAAPDIGAVITGRSQTSYGAVPTWVSSMSLFQLTELVGTRPELVGAGLGVGPGDETTGAFSGGIYDPTRKYFILWGGGHNDSGNNGVYAIRLGLDTPDVVALKSRTVATSNNVAYYSDGTPSSRHSYGTLQYHPMLDGLFSPVACSVWNPGPDGRFANADCFRLATNTWEPAGSVASMIDNSQEFEGAGTIDHLGRVYYTTGRNGSRIYRWTPTPTTILPGTWALWSTTALFSSFGSSINNSLVFDSNRQRVVFFGEPGAAKHALVSGSSFTNFTFTGAAAADVDNESACFCPSRDSFFVLVDASPPRVIEVNASTFVCTQVTLTGATPPAKNASSSYNKIKCDDELGIVVFHHRNDQDNVFAFRYR